MGGVSNQPISCPATNSFPFQRRWVIRLRKAAQRGPWPPFLRRFFAAVLTSLTMRAPYHIGIWPPITFLHALYMLSWDVKVRGDPVTNSSPQLCKKHGGSGNKRFFDEPYNLHCKPRKWLWCPTTPGGLTALEIRNPRFPLEPLTLKGVSFTCAATDLGKYKLPYHLFFCDLPNRRSQQQHE